MGYSPNGKIRNQEGWWIHRSSDPGAYGLYLNYTQKSVHLCFTSTMILFTIFFFQETKPKKKASARRNALASALWLQRKIVKTLNESMDEFNNRRKSLWWSRWIPKEE